MDRHGVVIDTEGRIDVELLGFGLLGGSPFLTEDSDVEFTVVSINVSILVTSVVLLDLFASDVVIRVTSDLFIKGLLVSFKIVHSYPEFSVITFSNCYGSCRVI